MNEGDHRFYVSAVDGNRFALLAGPFRIHDTALLLVERCNKIACDQDDKAWFYGFGTVKMADGEKPGKLNDDIDYNELLAWEGLHL